MRPFILFLFDRQAAMGVDNMTVAMPFRLDARYKIIETLGREVFGRVSDAGTKPAAQAS
jgi:hypothetical protein